MKVVLYLHMHQPWRLARYRYLDRGSGRSYFDEERNLAIFRGIAERSYRPALDRLAEGLREEPGFRLSLSVTGTFLEQAERAAPDVIDRVRALVSTGRVALVGETYYHSLAFLLPPPELKEEVSLHRRRLHELFGASPRVLRMTELVYSDELARFAREEGFAGMLAEGWEGALAGRPVNRLYEAASAPGLRLLLRNYRLSDDVGFRFSNRGWSEYPLTSEKYASWIARSPGEVTGIFMDFETFGEHHPASTGILDFLRALPRAVAREPGLEWATVEEALAGPIEGPLSVPSPMSWADEHRDLGAWMGNDLQKTALRAAQTTGAFVRQSGDLRSLVEWRRLLTSDHFYYMYLGGMGADEGVHQYFSSYGSPYDAYTNYMNAIGDLRRRTSGLPVAQVPLTGRT